MSTALDQALAHHRGGRLQEADTAYRAILAGAPDHAEAWHMLGLLTNERGQPEAAAEMVQHAIALKPRVAEFHGNLGLILRALKKPAEALACYQHALTIDPSNAALHNNAGTALESLGRIGEAVTHYRRAIDLKPDYAIACNNLGVALRRLNDIDGAIGCFRRALDLDPGFVRAGQGLAEACHAGGKLEEAVAAYGRLLTLTPDAAEAHNGLGAALAGLERWDDAMAACDRALRIDPNFAAAHFNRANILRAQNQDEAAASGFLSAIEARPDYAEAHNNLGAVRERQGRFDEAARSYRRALAVPPDMADAHYNLGNVLKEQGELTTAIESYRRALAIAPLAEGYNNLATALKDQSLRDTSGDVAGLKEAEACYRRALERDPANAGIHLNLAFLLLLMGDFPQGWREYEWRWQTPHFLRRTFRQPAWQGEPLAGQTILLHAEQGLGDTLQFVRYASVIREQGGRAVVLCQGPLRRLLAESGIAEACVAHGETLPTFDRHVPMMSLPLLFGTTLSDVPVTVPYLSCPAELMARWRETLAPYAGLKVGIAWRGNPDHRRDRFRSIPLAAFAPLADLPDVQLFSLQKGTDGAELANLGERMRIVDLAPQLDDFLDTAAAVMNLDLVICCDTAIAHLAGALGRPTWCALSYTPDWRWLLGRSDSPWYPSVRLFRQNGAEDWTAVLARMADALR
ncbi:tetratricopeptide repeat protein [Microbacteriaceae bacterium K1510]|nr:tetratricopeptide repeat protein [Microbacteriaceae bacterium K1510]